MTSAALDLPNPGLIYDLFTGVFRPQIVRLALQLDVSRRWRTVRPLRRQWLPPAAAARSASPTCWMCWWACIYSPGKRAITHSRPSTATFLVRGRPAYAGDLILAWTGPAIWENVEQAVRSGGLAPFEEYCEQDAWLESYNEWRITNSREMW